MLLASRTAQSSRTVFPGPPASRPKTLASAAAHVGRAAQRLTGLPARVSAGKLELHFGDETGLEELVEALEAL